MRSLPAVTVEPEAEYAYEQRRGQEVQHQQTVLEAVDILAQGAADLAAFAEGLEPVAGETVISKQYASAFFGTSLASTLTALGVDTVLIAGLSTSGCVRASTVDCCQHGFVPVVVREAVGDRAPGPHEANLFDLQAKYAEVASLADALNYLRSFPR